MKLPAPLAIPVTLILASLLLAQPADAPRVRRLLSVTYSLAEHKLHWEVAEGHKSGGDFVVEKLLEQPEIDPDACTMTVAGRTKKFEAAEGAALHRMLDTLAKYAAESSEWFDDDSVPEAKGTVAYLTDESVDGPMIHTKAPEFHVGRNH